MSTTLNLSRSQVPASLALSLYQLLPLQFSSVLFKVIIVHAGERPIICAPPHLSQVLGVLPLRCFQCWSDRWWPFVLSKKIIALAHPSFCTSLLQAIDGVMSWLCVPRWCRKLPNTLSHYPYQEQLVTGVAVDLMVKSAGVNTDWDNVHVLEWRGSSVIFFSWQRFCHKRI